MSDIGLTDIEIVHSVKNGDTKTLIQVRDGLRSQYFPLVHHLVVTKSNKEKQLAEEIMQLSMVKMLEAITLNRFNQEKGTIDAYFKAIIHNTWASFLRMEKRTRDALHQYKRQISHEDTVYQKLEDARVSKEQKLQFIDKMLHRLEKENPLYARVLQQYWLENKSLKEIAAQSGKSYANVRKLHERAKLKARTIFQEILQRETQ